MSKSNKHFKRRLSLFLVFVLAFGSVVSVSAEELSQRNYSTKEDISYENYRLADLPEVIANSILTTDTTPVEIINQDTDDIYSITVKNSDGTNTLHIFQTPIKYVEGNSVKLKDTAINSSTKRISMFDTYAYESGDNEIKGYFPEHISDGVKVEYDDYSVTLTPMPDIDLSNSEVKATSTVARVGNSVAYTDVFGENVSLEYFSTLNGVKENIILAEYSGKNTFSFIIDTDGLVPEKMSGDSIPLLDPETGEMKLYIGQINAKDSYTGDNENDDTHFTLYNSLELEQIGNKADVYKLTIVVDKEFLESETTVYPVTIDPTVSMAATNMSDAPVFSGYPTRNYYTNEYNMVGYHGSSYKEAISYVKLNTLSSYKYINPQKINLAYYRVYEGSGKTSTATINLYDTVSTWNDTTITYNNKPSFAGNAASSQTISSSGWYLFSITSLFKNWLQGTLGEGGFSHNYGFALSASTTGVSSRHFCSANSANYLPTIVVQYSEDTSIADGVYYIKSKYSNLYLDTEQDPNANGNVIQYNIHGNTNQHWTVKYQGDGYYKLYSQWYNEEKCLDVESSPNQNGSNVDVYNDGDGDYVLFKIVSNNDGTYRIISKWSNNQKVLDVCGPSTAATANIQIWEYVGVNQQKWYFEPVNEKNISFINSLYSLAEEYNSSDATILTFQYLRSGIYNSNRWVEVAGAVDSSFHNYVSNNSDLTFLKSTHQYLYDSYQRIDFSHMCAVINAMLYNSTSFESIAVGENVVDDLAGWAGDLQTLVIDMLDNVDGNYLNNYNSLYNKFNDLMGSPYYSFSEEDFLADLDAVYYVGLFGNSTSNVAINLTNYYNMYSQNRYTNFVDNRTKDALNSDVYFYTRNKYTKLNVEIVQWPLYDESHEITKVQAEAAADAFTDYVWSFL